MEKAKDTENKIKKFYIADVHFGHNNILFFDKRPWHDLAHMERDMISAWNTKVREYDEVYILGDLILGNADEWRRIVPNLHGKKFLITGNHDLRQIPGDVCRMFVKVSPYYETHDGIYHIVMSHYPMIAYEHDVHSGVLMLYGHVHNTEEFKALKKAVAVYKEQCEKKMYPYQGNLFNCWCGFYDYAPATLEEILSNKNNH